MKTANLAEANIAKFPVKETGNDAIYSPISHVSGGGGCQLKKQRMGEDNNGKVARGRSIRSGQAAADPKNSDRRNLCELFELPRGKYSYNIILSFSLPPSLASFVTTWIGHLHDPLVLRGRCIFVWIRFRATRSVNERGSVVCTETRRGENFQICVYAPELTNPLLSALDVAGSYRALVQPPAPSPRANERLNIYLRT